MRIPVRTQREIARLHFSTKAPSRKIAAAVGTSRTTVQTLVKLIAKSGKTWADLGSYSDGAWKAALGSENKQQSYRKATPNWEFVHEERIKQDVTLHELWRQWREETPTGIAYSQFSRGYRIWLGRQRLSMRQIHIPGDKMFVDFCGRTVRVNPPSKEAFQAQIFVAVLGASNYTFVLAVRSQAIRDWIKCIVAAFQFFGGVPNWIVSDNLKSAVIGRHGRDAVINPTYQQLLHHYDTAALPARPGRPKDKGKVEVGVQIVQRWILATLRNRLFSSLTELNEAIQDLQKRLNERSFKKLVGCRRSRFEELDKPALKQLPASNYEYAEWRFDVLVPDDYHIEHERSFYSTPSVLAHVRVDLKITATLIEVFRERTRVASHPRSYAPGTVVTNKEHLPVNHQRVLEGEPRMLILWAETVGPYTEKLIRWHLVERKDRRKGLMTAQRFRRLSEDFGTSRFEEVCAYAVPLNFTSHKSIVSILRTNSDKRSQHSSKQNPNLPHHHEYLRGAEYYGGE